MSFSGLTITLRAAIYLRVSTQEQSTELQRVEIQQYILSRGWTLYQIYEDKATGTNGDRTNLKQVFVDAKQRKFDVLVVWKLDRFFRSLSQLLKGLEEFETLGVKFVSLKDQIDLTTASGRLLMHLIAAFAEFEAALIKERVISGLANARRKGKRLGRPPQASLSTVLELRQANMSLSQIAKELGISKSTVSKTLTKHRLNKAVQNTESLDQLES
jgi:putative DNA-invertase from lambdoid prophage Rac